MIYPWRMTVADFEKQPRGPRLFERWIGQQRITTPLGSFSIEFHMENDDTDPPDEEMLKRATELVSYTESHGDAILDIVFGHYLLTAEDRYWLEDCGVSRGVTRNRIAEYVRPDRSLVVARHLSSDQPYSSSISVVPLWDEEHALALDFANGEIISANDSRFRLEADVLRWVD